MKSEISGLCQKSHFIDFRINNGTKIAITLDPLTFILSPVSGGEGGSPTRHSRFGDGAVRGM